MGTAAVAATARWDIFEGGARKAVVPARSGAAAIGRFARYTGRLTTDGITATKREAR